MKKEKPSKKLSPSYAFFKLYPCGTPRTPLELAAYVDVNAVNSASVVMELRMALLCVLYLFVCFFVSLFVVRDQRLC